MIPISLQHALALYTIVLGVVIVVIWLYAELTVRRPQRFLAKQFLWRCVFCGYMYLDEGAESISECPRCGSLNALEDKHARFVKPRAAASPVEEDDLTAKARRNPSRRKRPQQKRRGPRRR